MSVCSLTVVDDNDCRATWQVEIVDDGVTPEGEPWVLLHTRDYCGHARRKVAKRKRKYKPRPRPEPEEDYE